GDDVSVMHMHPLVIATVFTLLRRERIAGITLQPSLNDIVIELLRPQHAPEGLAYDVLCIRSEVRRGNSVVKLIGLLSALGEGKIKARAEGPCWGRGHLFVSEPEFYDCALPGRDSNLVMAGHFGP